jgi:hypothetical protein
MRHRYTHSEWERDNRVARALDPIRHYCYTWVITGLLMPITIFLAASEGLRDNFIPLVPFALNAIAFDLASLVMRIERDRVLRQFDHS